MTLPSGLPQPPWPTRERCIYADFAQVLVGIARPMYATEPPGIDLDATVNALQASPDLIFAKRRRP